MKPYTMEEAREWAERAERAAAHLDRFPKTTWRRFLESTIAAAQGVVRGAAPAAPAPIAVAAPGPRSA